MPLSLTLALFAAFAGLAAFASWRSAQPADPLKPRLAPWRAIMIAAGFGAFLMALHLVNLAGIETGRR